MSSEPRFPLRIIYSDGQLQVIDSPEDLLEQIDSIDSTAVPSHLWIRDEADRTVRLRMTAGEVELLEVE